MTDEIDPQDLYLDTKKHRPRPGWLIAGLLLVLLLLGSGGLAAALAAGYLSNPLAAGVQPTPLPTATPLPRPTATPPPPLVTFTANPWTGGGPVDLVELVLSVPEKVHVTHDPPPGFRYWRGDLLPTRQGFAYSSPGPAEIRWFLLREPDAALPATVQVTVDGQPLLLTLAPDTPATASVLLK
jgi:hypothetical protein